MKKSALFEVKPAQWGMRGDPYFWGHLKDLIDGKEDIATPDDLERFIKNEFYSLSGNKKEMTGAWSEFIIVDRFAHGGMTSGGVSGEWWIEDGIPLLKSRFEHFLRAEALRTDEEKGFVIRPERDEDHREVEELVRESFWNVYRPGCLEHYVIHLLRDDEAFVRDLDVVMEKDGRIIGQNIFMKTVIVKESGWEIPVLTMGPICIANGLKRQGYGRKLLDYSLEAASAMGFGAVLFEGNIGFYGGSGFDYASKFGIKYHDLPEGADASFFLCRELRPGYLDNAAGGVYRTPAGYYVDEAECEEFDRSFPPKVKLKLPGQLVK